MRPATWCMASIRDLLRSCAAAALITTLVTVCPSPLDVVKIITIPEIWIRTFKTYRLIEQLQSRQSSGQDQVSSSLFTLAWRKVILVEGQEDARTPMIHDAMLTCCMTPLSVWPSADNNYHQHTNYWGHYYSGRAPQWHLVILWLYAITALRSQVQAPVLMIRR